MKILIIEEKSHEWEALKTFFSEHNFLVNIKQDTQLAYQEIKKNTYNILVFHLTIPFKESTHFIKCLRDKGIKIPIIILSKDNSFETKKLAFTMWADDFLICPYNPEELLLRVRAILKRRLNTEKINELCIGDITLNLDSRTVKRCNSKIELTPKEFQILEYLMENTHRVVPKHELLVHIWWYNNDIWSDVTRSHIQIIRAKINNWFIYDPIKTIRWVWFKFENKKKSD
jgi:DNA-binding response OmpR family regulator